MKYRLIEAKYIGVQITKKHQEGVENLPDRIKGHDKINTLFVTNDRRGFERVYYVTVDDLFGWSRLTEGMWLMLNVRSGRLRTINSQQLRADYVMFEKEHTVAPVYLIRNEAQIIDAQQITEEHFEDQEMLPFMRQRNVFVNQRFKTGAWVWDEDYVKSFKMGDWVYHNLDSDQLHIMTNEELERRYERA